MLAQQSDINPWNFFAVRGAGTPGIGLDPGCRSPGFFRRVWAIFGFVLAMRSCIPHCPNTSLSAALQSMFLYLLCSISLSSFLSIIVHDS
jgi:hypothetical protein